jgi:hypothetical protein
MTQVQLPPKFQPHPEVAAGVVTLDQAVMMMERDWLTYEGACYLLPPRAWPLLPKSAETMQPQGKGWVHKLKHWRAS